MIRSNTLSHDYSQIISLPLSKKVNMLDGVILKGTSLFTFILRKPTYAQSD